MSARREPGVAFYRCVYAAGCLGVVTACALAVVCSARAGAWPLLAAGLAGLAAFVAAVRRRGAELRAYAHIPGPRPSLFVGNLPALMHRGHGGRDRAIAALHAEYGAIVRIHLAWGSGTYVSLAYASTNLHRRDLDSQRRADRTVLPDSLMGMPRDERHRAHRQVVAPHFTAGAVKAGAPRVRELAAACVGRWLAGGGVEAAALQADVHRWSAHCMGAYLFGAAWDAEADLDGYFAALGEIEEEISFRAFHPFFVRWLFPRRARAARAAYRHLAGFLERVLARRVAPGCPHHAERRADVLGEFARLHGEGAWSRRECVEEMLSLVIGGTDAMSYAIGQALVLLARGPAVQAEARRRISAAAGGAEVAYVRHILYESYRLFPPVPFSAKVAPAGLVEGGLAIPRGTSLLWAKNVVGRNAAVFHEPDEFRPERWEAGGESPASMLPFGAGPRHCVGSRLADEQCTALLTEILRTFAVEAVAGVEVDYRATVTITPSAVPVRLVPRT